ncbi:MAG: HAD-IIIA family hydrolase [Nanoarchaeota archaeon]|nr:HAD-IIIA family hydrolase [Nanoarchaeota archaeon]
MDRDGVINSLLYHDDKGIYSASDMGEFEVLEGVREAIHEIKGMGFLAIVVSNQPGVAFGYIKKEDLKKIDEYMRRELGIDAVYNCVHHPKYTGDCDCRKPKSGLLLKAADEYDIDLDASYMVGDLLSDILAGKVCKKTIMVSKVNCALCKFIQEKDAEPDFFAEDLLGAVKIIKKTEGKQNENLC